MIIVKGRELLVPGNERYLGTTYDNISENRVFLIPRFSQNGTDLSALNFRLDFLYANGSHQYDTITLVKTVNDEYITLTWPIREEILQVPGTVIVQIRAIDTENTVKWSTFQAAFYVERHLNTPGNYSGSLTEIEQMEQDFEYMKGVVDELKANIDYAHDAEAWAKGTRSGSAVPSTDDTYHNNSKYYSEQASTKATAAANSATAAANSATQAAETVADTNTRFNNAVAAVTSETELIDARVGADGTQYTVLKARLDAEHTDVKSAITNTQYTDFTLASAIDTSAWTNNSNGAVASNNDGSYNVGTTDFGNTLFQGTLKAGIYNLFGVPVGFSFVSTNTSHSTGAVATNDTGKTKRITIESDGTYYFGWRIPSKPSAGFSVRPFIIRVYDIAGIESDIDDIENDISALEDNNADIYAVLDNEPLTYADFISGVRDASSGVSTNTARCTSARTFYLRAGDRIAISDIDSGTKVVIAGVKNGSYVFDSGWKESAYAITVINEGAYFINIAMTDGTSAILPSNIINLTLTVSYNSVYLTNAKKLIDNGTRRNLLGEQIGTLYPVSLHKGDVITFSTSDGSVNTNATLRIYYFDNAKNLIDYNSFGTGSNVKTITLQYDNVAYIAQSGGCGVPVQVEIGASKTAFQKYIDPDIDYISQIAEKGYWELDSISDVVNGTYDNNGYNFEAADRSHYKNIFVKANKGDYIEASSSAHDILVAVVSNPTGYAVPNLLYTTGWKRKINFVSDYDGYYVFLSKASASNFDARFKVTPVSVYSDDSGASDIYESEISATVASVRALQTEPSLVFPLLTDIHYGISEAGDNFLFKNTTIKNMRAVVNQIRSDLVVCLGDITEGNSENTGTYSTLIGNLLRSLGAPYLLAVGNHDDNRYGTTFSAAEMYEYYDSFVDNHVSPCIATNGRDFYIDMENYKVRFIVLDSNNVGSYGFPQDCVDWFEQTALNTPSGYLAIVFVHQSPIASQNYNNTALTNGSAIASAIETYAASKPIIQFYGHSHCDVSFTSPYLSIGTNCAKFENTNGDPSLWPSGAVKPSRVVGTITEECWDMVVIRPLSRKVDCVRFGAGSDRSFTY